MMKSGSGSNMVDKGRILPADPNLPRFLCQNCHQNLFFVGVDSYADKFLAPGQGSSIQGTGSRCSKKMDNSYIVLPKQRNQIPVLPPRPRGGAVLPDASQSGKAIDESFVVLPPPAASVYKFEPWTDGNGTNSKLPQGDPTNTPMQQNNSGFHSTITILNRAFDIATTQTQVEQPLCLECMRILSDKLDKEVEDVNRDIVAYEASLQRLEGEAKTVLSDAEFLKEKLKIEEEERKVEAAIAETEKQRKEVTGELKELELKSARFKELEERFGPVNVFWSTRYDKAMTLFLACLKEFAEFANSNDKENNIPSEKCFKLPYKIENDKVENYSITQSFNKPEN